MAAALAPGGPAWLLVLAALAASDAWHSDRKPRLYGARIPKQHLTPIHKHVQDKIVLYHNFFRANVEPSAKDMLLMKWHGESARSAQRWAEECRFLQHDNITGRWIDRFGSCGQNIFVSTHQVPWFFAVETWNLEKRNFTYGAATNNLTLVGHYTQLVGCGFHKCPKGGNRGKPYYAYVCNYCPMGNHMHRLGRPYESGGRCEACPKRCRKGLCTNACPAADLWANCRELFASWPHWLCRSGTPQGRQRLDHCRATCRCRNRIT
ncbi:Cysteine-rich secretory protein 3 [Frankliniella fusca]|uniref:Cysteine-rich secretory protein 3 n=1 Tax=Frankliniella fusca TaxID=407009 RepID=A0AAE1HH01_9NEOP|nr:Cysteine-rich secretory protein 3 [Frankliniella fusca]